MSSKPGISNLQNTSLFSQNISKFVAACCISDILPVQIDGCVCFRDYHIHMFPFTGRYSLNLISSSFVILSQVLRPNEIAFPAPPKLFVKAASPFTDATAPAPFNPSSSSKSKDAIRPSCRSAAFVLVFPTQIPGGTREHTIAAKFLFLLFHILRYL